MVWIVFLRVSVTQTEARGPVSKANGFPDIGGFFGLFAEKIEELELQFITVQVCFLLILKAL